MRARVRHRSLKTSNAALKAVQFFGGSAVSHVESIQLHRPNANPKRLMVYRRIRSKVHHRSVRVRCLRTGRQPVWAGLRCRSTPSARLVADIAAF